MLLSGIQALGQNLISAQIYAAMAHAAEPPKMRSADPSQSLLVKGGKGEWVKAPANGS